LCGDRVALFERRQATEGEEKDVEGSATSLYDRLGGIYSIATAIDDFIDRIMVDDSRTRIRASTRRTIACCRRDSSTW
jgi:hypothetical protein